MFKKPSGARANIRKREEDGETETTTLTTKNDDSNSINSGTENSSNATNNAVTAVSQKNQNKRNSDDSDNDSDSDSDDEGINKEALHKSKKMRQSTSSAASASTTSSTSTSSSGSSSSNDISVKFESNKSVNSAGPQDMGATMTNQANPILAPGQASATGLKGARAGPMKGSANIRATVRFDYQMDVCKDYKETGYCGFGDTCIFMHDRGDYKTGWQLELEWQAQQKAKAQGGGKESKDSKDGKDKDRKDDDLPFACHICRKEFVNPVVTRCKHYFCESCALAHAKKSNKCFICQQPTNGIFNTAKELADALKRKTKRQELEGNGKSDNDDRLTRTNLSREDESDSD